MKNEIIDQDIDYVIKLVLVGESSVGKTNILSRYTKGEFLENSKATLGVECGTKFISIQDIKLKLQIWDTAGQERYKALTSSFYKNSSGALVVFDLSKESTFEKVDTWIEELKEKAGDKIFIILVGNKSDLKENREVSEEDAYEKAEKYSNSLLI